MTTENLLQCKNKMYVSKSTITVIICNCYNINYKKMKIKNLKYTAWQSKTCKNAATFKNWLLYINKPTDTKGY